MLPPWVTLLAEASPLIWPLTSSASLDSPQPPEPGCAFSVTTGLVSAAAGSAVEGNAASIASAIAAEASDLCRRSRGRAVGTASLDYMSPTAIGGLVAGRPPSAGVGAAIV